MIKAGIIGSTGYAGAELVRILVRHPEVEIRWFGSRSFQGQNYADVYRNFFRLIESECSGDEIARLADEVGEVWRKLLPKPSYRQ